MLANDRNEEISVKGTKVWHSSILATVIFILSIYSFTVYPVSVLNSFVSELFDTLSSSHIERRVIFLVILEVMKHMDCLTRFE